VHRSLKGTVTEKAPLEVLKVGIKFSANVRVERAPIKLILAEENLLRVGISKIPKPKPAHDTSPANP
jgi:hypothetical protein